MAGVQSIADPDRLTGYIELIGSKRDLETWSDEGEKLLEHIRRVMSLASGSILRCPINQYYCGSQLVVTALSQSKQSLSALRLIHHLDQQGIFETAVKSFFR
jgi:hypothetical protein